MIFDMNLRVRSGGFYEFAGIRTLICCFGFHEGSRL